VKEVNEINKFNYLVMCIDADELNVSDRRNEVLSFIEDNEIKLNEGVEFVLIIQNRCIETGCNSNCRSAGLSSGFPENIGDEVEFLTA
jgi:hypothetical protein